MGPIGGSHGSSSDDRNGEEADCKARRGIEGNGGRYRIAVPLLNGAEAGTGMDPMLKTGDVSRLLETAGAIARQHDGEVLVAEIVTYPRQTPLERAREDPAVARANARVEHFVRALDRHSEVTVRGTVHVTHGETRTVLELIDEKACDAALLGVRDEASQRRRLLTGNTIEKIVARAECDVFVQRYGAELIGVGPEPGSTPIGWILLAAGRGPHSGLAAVTARELALATGARIDVLHAISEDAAIEAERAARGAVDAATRVLDGVTELGTEVVRTDDVAREIVTRSAAYDVAVLGAPTQGLLRQFVFGSLPETVRQDAETTVLMTKENTPDRTQLYYRWLGDDVR